MEHSAKAHRLKNVSSRFLVLFFRSFLTLAVFMTLRRTENPIELKGQSERKPNN